MKPKAEVILGANVIFKSIKGFPLNSVIRGVDLISGSEEALLVSRVANWGVEFE